MGYHQLTGVERYLIVEHKSMGLSLRGIAKALCRDVSTISRELRRNADKSIRATVATEWRRRTALRGPGDGGAGRAANSSRLKPRKCDG